ncbi:MAG: hypothetical protein ABIB61_02490 [Candidatus Shapirobacteria bacterium]
MLGVILSLYLLVPGPKLPPLDLPESLKSDEPGDTYQIFQASAYYTDKEREEVISFYDQYFSHSSFLNFPLFTYRLNHPPEYAREIWVDTKQSYYLEEIVNPFRGSLYVNGYEWARDVFTPVEAREQYALIVGGRVWPSKVSLRYFSSFWIVRLVVFWASWLMLGWIIGLWAKEFKRR